MRIGAITLVLSIGLSGCMVGDMKGVLSDGKPVVMKYEQNMTSDTYSTVIDGESFEGRAVPIGDSVTFGTAFGASYNSYGTTFGNTFGTGYSSSGKFKAILIGSAGSSLRCLMEYADSSGFTNMGGVGECVHSDGRTLVINW